MTSVLDSRADLKILNHTAVLIQKMESLTLKSGRILQKLTLFYVFKVHQLTVHPCFQVSGARGGSGSSESRHHNVRFKEEMPQTCGVYISFSPLPFLHSLLPPHTPPSCGEFVSEGLSRLPRSPPPPPQPPVWHFADPDAFSYFSILIIRWQ